MDILKTTPDGGKKPPVDAGKENNGARTASNTFIPDECGDTLWDDVLAQKDKRTTIQNKSGNTMPKDAGSL